MMKTATIIVGLAISAAFVAPVFAEEATSETVVATVNGSDITLGQMIAIAETLPAQYQSLPDDVLFKGILDQLIQQTALEQTAGELSKRDQLALANNRRGYISGVALQAVVDAAITDEALKAAYDAQYASAEPQTEYNAAHILVDSEELAKELKAKIDAGEDFAKLAKENSKDTGSGAAGGELGWFGLGMMVKPFEDAVIAAEVGKVTEPVQSQFGWHIILVKETRPKAAPALDEVRDQLAAEIEKKTVEAHLKAVTDAATITRPGEGLDPKLLRDATLLDK